MEIKYFANIKSLEELKREYRKLGKQFHPDNGGSEETFKIINHEYNLQKRKIENGEYQPIKIIRYSKTGAKWFTGINISYIVEMVKQFISENYSDLLFEIEIFKSSFLIHWKQTIDMFQELEIKRAIENILEEYNKIDYVKYPYEPVEETAFFKFRGFVKYKKPVEEMEAWEFCGYSCDWSKCYKTA